MCHKTVLHQGRLLKRKHRLNYCAFFFICAPSFSLIDSCPTASMDSIYVFHVGSTGKLDPDLLLVISDLPLLSGTQQECCHSGPNLINYQLSSADLSYSLTSAQESHTVHAVIRQLHGDYVETLY